jgi:hypothetical protein
MAIVEVMVTVMILFRVVIKENDEVNSSSDNCDVNK